MAEFLVELSLSKTDAPAVSLGTKRFDLAAAELTAAGRPVRLVGTLFVLKGESCFLLVEAATADDVRDSARRAAVRCVRVAESASDTEVTAVGPPKIAANAA